MAEVKFNAPVQAIQWTGAENELEAARAMLAPRYNVFRMRDRLRGDCLKITEGDKTKTVPRGCWLVTLKVDDAVGVMEDSAFRAVFGPKAVKPAHAVKA